MLKILDLMQQNKYMILNISDQKFDIKMVCFNLSIFFFFLYMILIMTSCSNIQTIFGGRGGDSRENLFQSLRVLNGVCGVHFRKA